jgi:hypothetical protein
MGCLLNPESRPALIVVAIVVAIKLLHTAIWLFLVACNDPYS